MRVELIVMCCHALKLFQAAEQSSDSVALSVAGRVVGLRVR
jgi:hypothetical protein